LVGPSEFAFDLLDGRQRNLERIGQCFQKLVLRDAERLAVVTESYSATHTRSARLDP